MICTRAMQLLVKRTATTFKTLEGQLLAMNRGERTTISTKCAELDTQVPIFLGVSRAILDYVIFCHQDESLWPLSEPSILKKRFDEIFEALKFTKALDNIKAIRKDLALELKLLDQSVKHMQIDKQRADKTRVKLQTTKGQIEEYLGQTKILEDKLRKVTEESDALFSFNQEFQKVLSSLENSKQLERSLTEQLNRLEIDTQILPEKDEDLQYQLANFQVSIAKKKDEVLSLKDEVKLKLQILKETRQKYNLVIREEGQLKVKEAEYYENIKSRKEDMCAAKKEMKLDLDLDDPETPKVFNNLLSSKLTEAERHLAEIERESFTGENALIEKLRTISNNRLKELHHKEYTQKDLVSLSEEIRSLQKKINSIQANETDLQYEKTSLEHLEKQLLQLKEEKSVEKLVKEIKLKNSEIITLENEVEELSNSIARYHRQSESNAKISILKEEKQRKEKVFAKLLETTSQFLEEGDYNNAEDNLTKKLDNGQRKIDLLAEEVSGLSKKIAQEELSLSFKVDEIEELEREFRLSRQKYSEELQDESVTEYGEILEAAEEDYKISLENLKMSSTTLQFNKKSLEIAENEKCCYLCSRKFDDSAVLSIFIEDLKMKTETKFIDELKNQVEQQKAYVAKVRSLAADVNGILNFPKKSALLKEAKDRSEEILRQLNVEVNDKTRELDDVKYKYANLESAIKPVGEISRMKNELNNIEVQLADKHKEFDNFGSSSTTLNDLQKAQNEKMSLLKSLRKEVGSLLEEKDSQQREYTILEGNVKYKKLKISGLERISIERENLLKAVEENKLKMEKLKQIEAKSGVIISQIDGDISSVTKSLESLKLSNSQRKELQKSEVELLNKLFVRAQSYSNSINSYFTSEKSLLEGCQKEAKDLESKTKYLEDEIDKTNSFISEEEKKLADSSSIERNLRNNLNMRQLQKDLRLVGDEISKIDMRNAENQRDKYQEQSLSLREKYSSLNAQLAGKMGEIKQLEDQVQQVQKELNTEFRNIDNVYQEEWVKFQTKTLVNDDLNTYARALDSAIMQYHGIKMQEINRIIDELWKATYSGSDIDTIMIRSDQNTGAKGNRTYNYRVVMLKQDAELDMRGRCSAGQKVLASIIIRLALAECFGTNCGVIALDEPTTNLDTDNIESLARSLGNIIELRRSQKNFQLIVITHDEKFLSYMNASKYTDHFYRIKRNERQKSQIEWVNISKVSE